jgi:hypothetical protein
MGWLYVKRGVAYAANHFDLPASKPCVLSRMGRPFNYYDIFRGIIFFVPIGMMDTFIA